MDVYVLAENTCHAIYKAYKRVLIETKQNANNEDYKRWKMLVSDVEKLHSIDADTKRVNLY